MKYSKMTNWLSTEKLNHLELKVWSKSEIEEDSMLTQLKWF